MKCVHDNRGFYPVFLEQTRNITHELFFGKEAKEIKRKTIHEERRFPLHHS
jgi:hypothetical protein